MKKCTYLFLAILLISTKIFAQCQFANDSRAPKELLRKRLKDNELGFRYGNPYTLFNRSDNNNWTLAGAIDQIRKNIVSGLTSTRYEFSNDYAEFYKGIWFSASAVESDNCTAMGNFDDKSLCLHAAWVKNNAILYIIGLKYDTLPNNRDF